MSAVTRNTLVWQGSGSPALELAAVDVTGGGLSARGTAIVTASAPFSLAYRLETSAGPVAVSLVVTAWGADWSRSLELRRRPDGTWTAEPGGPLPALEGALDCDLGRSCLTKSMPVLRNRLHERGGSTDVLVAWVSVPDLEVQVARHRYTHLARTGGRGAVVRFESGVFATEIEFDSEGFVADYPGLARRRY